MLTSPFLKNILFKSGLAAFFSNYFLHQLLDLLFFGMRYGFWMTVVISFIFFLELLLSRFSGGSLTGFFISAFAGLFFFSFLGCFLFSLPPFFPLGLSSG